MLVRVVFMVPTLTRVLARLFLAHSLCRLLHVNAGQEMAKVGARVKLKYPRADSVGRYDGVGQRGAIPVLQHLGSIPSSIRQYAASRTACFG